MVNTWEGFPSQTPLSLTGKETIMSMHGRDGKDTHHFEMFVHREHIAQRKRDIRAAIKGSTIGAIWGVYVVIAWFIG